MKKMNLGIILGLTLLTSALSTLAIRQAVAAPEISTRIIATWDSLNVAAGAVITSPVITTARLCGAYGIFADNSAGGSSRTLNIDWLAVDGTTILYRRAITVTNATRAAVLISPTASSATTSGETVIPAMPGDKMQFTLASAGAAAGSLVVYCRQ